MSNKSRVTREALAAMGASIRLFSRVSSLVCDKVGAQDEAFPAVSTTEGFFPRVNSLVANEPRAAGEGFAALYAIECLFSMPFLVSCET